MTVVNLTYEDHLELGLMRVLGSPHAKINYVTIKLQFSVRHNMGVFEIT